jgi:hypothetical protein
MAVSATVANKLKYLMATKKIDFENDAFKCCLMNTTFSFDKDTHHYYSNIAGDELANGNGYTTGGQTLTGVTVTENDSADRCDVAWNNPTWTASGGSIGGSCYAIVYDDTVTEKPIVGCIDFDSTQTAATGENFLISTVAFRLT